MIEVAQLNKYYNKGKKQEQHVLWNIDLTFERTGLVCILGESGSGKTTLLNAIGGLDDFTSGTIQIEDTTLTGYDPKRIEQMRNDHFGYIFQNYYLLSDYSVEYNIALALSRYDLTPEEKDVRIDQVLSMLDMSKYKHKLVSCLSGGQQQRISIARALVKTPDIILADEPTGNLDEENTLRTMQILKVLSKECLVLLVTHERRIARFFADRIIEISDGSVLRDEANISSLYQRSDDSDLYLKTMECTTLSNEFARFHIYHHKEESPAPIELNLVWQDHKLYLQNTENYDVMLEEDGSGFHIVDAMPPTLDIEEMEQLSLDLPKLPHAGSAKLSFLKALKMAVTNLQQAGRRQAFICIILLAAAVMLSVSLAQFMNTVSIDADSIVSTDTHYLQVDFENVSIFHTAEQLQVFDFAQKYLNDSALSLADPSASAVSSQIQAFYAPNVKLYLMGQGLLQLEKVKQPLPKYCYAPLSLLDETDLCYGRMPRTRQEVVLDKKVVQALMDSKGVLSYQLSSMEDYIGVSLKTAVSATTLTVTGICDTDQPDVYCGQNVLLAFSTKGYRIASLSDLQAEFPEDYSSLTLNEDQILLREGLYRSLSLTEQENYTIGDDSTHTYQIAGTVPDSFGVDYVMTDQGCRTVRDLMIYENRTCLIYAADQDIALDYLSTAEKENMKAFSLAVTVPYETEIQTYQDAHSKDFHAAYLIAAIILVISLLMIYFTMKSNALSRCEELTVYRLLGIAKSSIIKSYVLETLLLTSCTSLPAVLFTSFVIWFIGRIPSLETELLFTWWSVLLLLLIIYLVHALVSILPIRRILNLPPAALALKD